MKAASEHAAAARAAAERATASSRRRSLDAAWSALSPGEQASLTERAVAVMKSEAPQVHTWYQTERSSGTPEDEMRPSVRTTLRDYRDGLLASEASG